jgi:hypothetical protein
LNLLVLITDFTELSRKERSLEVFLKKWQQTCVTLLDYVYFKQACMCSSYDRNRVRICYNLHYMLIVNDITGIVYLKYEKYKKKYPYCVLQIVIVSEQMKIINDKHCLVVVKSITLIIYSIFICLVDMFVCTTLWLCSMSDVSCKLRYYNIRINYVI